MGLRPGSINVHIKELVLHGFPSVQRYAIGEAVEKELARMLQLQNRQIAFQHDIEVERMHGGTFQIQGDSSPHTIGANIARTVYQGLST
jgi:hypothetical protein